MKKIIIPILALLIVAIGSFLLGGVYGYMNYEKSEEYLKIQNDIQTVKGENSLLKRDLDNAQFTMDKMGILPKGAKYVKPIQYEPYLSPTPSL